MSIANDVFMSCARAHTHRHIHQARAKARLQVPIGWGGGGGGGGVKGRSMELKPAATGRMRTAEGSWVRGWRGGGDKAVKCPNR